MVLLSTLKTLVQLLSMLPSLWAFYKEIEKARKDALVRKAEEAEVERRKKMEKVAEKLKDAVRNGDEKKADEALDDLVDDYNRRS